MLVESVECVTSRAKCIEGVQCVGVCNKCQVCRKFNVSVCSKVTSYEGLTITRKGSKESNETSARTRTIVMQSKSTKIGPRHLKTVEEKSLNRNDERL